MTAAEAAERRSLKLRVRLLRAKLVRELEEEKVRSVVVLVKLRSRSESKNVCSSMVSDELMVFVCVYIREVGPMIQEVE